MRVLVVDDLAINRVLTMSLLRNVGVEAHGVGSAASALEALERETYHAILVDFYLGDMNGDELTRRIRKTYGGGHRIVGLSGDNDADIYDTAMQAGMDAFLCKPATIEALSEVLDPEGSRIAGC
ncbi:MAG: response regulator [Spirochaetaceae bacterium]|nr:MAG: response regulator [Spirochaetaceae bacterium]